MYPSSIEELKILSKNDPILERILSRQFATKYEDFLGTLQIDLVEIVVQLEKSANLQRDESEDQTTQRIVDMCHSMGYQAHHNAASGGNVDITVIQRKCGFEWLAEAKKFNSITDMKEGYLQLASRYRPGMIKMV
jgi:hypothetical protein